LVLNTPASSTRVPEPTPTVLAQQQGQQQQGFAPLPAQTVPVDVTPSPSEPVAQAAHGKLFANWGDPNQIPVIEPVAQDRWVVISSDPATFTLQDANGINVWQYATPGGCVSNCGALWFLEIPAGYKLYTQLHNWQPGAEHWPISGWSYTTFTDGNWRWQLIHYGDAKETKPSYITNVDGDLKSPTVSTERPVRTIP